MVTGFCRPQCRGMYKASIAEQYNPVCLVNWLLEPTITAFEDEKAIARWALTVILLFIVGFLLPLPVSFHRQVVKEYEGINSIWL